MKQRKKGDIAALIEPYNPPQRVELVKRTKGMIDLTSSFLEDYAAFHRDSEARMARERRLNEQVEIISELHEY
jgi:Mg-chelatase subunit ChlI